MLTVRRRLERVVVLDVMAEVSAPGRYANRVAPAHSASTSRSAASRAPDSDARLNSTYASSRACRRNASRPDSTSSTTDKYSHHGRIGTLRFPPMDACLFATSWPSTSISPQAALPTPAAHRAEHPGRSAVRQTQVAGTGRPFGLRFNRRDPPPSNVSNAVGGHGRDWRSWTYFAQFPPDAAAHRTAVPGRSPSTLATMAGGISDVSCRRADARIGRG